MKKRILSMLLVMAMLISMIVMPAGAETAAEAVCPHCDVPMSQITWLDWDGAAGDRNTTGHYRLTGEYTQNGQVKFTGGDTVLDLAGQTLSTTTASRPFYVNGGKLTILDTSEEKTGLVTGKATASGAVLFVNTNGTLDIYGGTYESAATTGSKGGTISINGNVTLHDGVIKGSTSTSTGGCLHMEKGSFTMEGGRLTAGNAGTSGGTVFAQGGTLNLSGGVIESGTVGSGKSGTAVFAYRAAEATPCTVNIGSVEIPAAEKNSTVIGGNVTLGISGAPKIGYMSINATSAPIVGEMEDGASVYLAISGSLPLAMENDQMETYLAKGYFKSYGAGTVLTTDGASLTTAAYTCPCCGEENVTWTEWDGNIVDGTHYYLTNDLELTAQIAIPADTSVTLDLRGKKIASEAVRAFMVRGNLDIVDSGVTGVVSTGNAGTNGGVFSVQKDGNLELHGGTYAALAAPAKGSVAYVIGEMTVHNGVKLDGTKAIDEAKVGSSVYVNGGTYTMDGGEIIGATAKRGGSIFVEAGALNVTGGTISGGKSNAVDGTGDDIYVQAATSVNLADCSVAKEVHINAAEIARVSGSVKLARLKLNPGVLLTLGELTDGADITVAASGTVSAANPNAAAYLAKGYIKAAEDKKLEVEDDMLVIKTYDCPCCDTPAADVVWTEWDGNIVDGGHYYLTEKLALDAQIKIPADTSVTVDLRGQEITSDATRAFIVYGNLDIVDSIGGGKVTTGTVDTNGGIFSVQENGSLELHDGSYIAQAAPAKGSIANVVGSMMVHEGVILDASAAVDNTKTCSAIYVKGSFNMDGGEIIGATAKRGGSIFVEAGELNITGGAISGGAATAADGSGDDIYVFAATSVTLADCAVAEEIHVNAADVITVSGDAQLGRLKLNPGILLTLGELTENAQIMVAATGVFTVENENAAKYLEAGYIKAANASSILVVSNNCFKFLSDSDPKCPHCDLYMEEISWQPYNAGDIKATGGHFYLTKEITRTQQLQINAGVDSVIDLRDNDFTVTAAGVRAFIVYGTLTVMDTVDNGTVTGLNTGNGGVYNVQAGGELNLLGGTSAAGADATLGGVIYVEGGNVNIKGGTVKGGKATLGGNIYAASGAAVEISGGVIGGGTALLNASGKNGFGGNIYAADGAKILFSAGNVQNGKSDSYGGNIYIAKGAEMDLSGGAVRGGAGDVAAKLTSGFRGDNIYVEGTLNMSEGHITVTNTDCFGNAVLARGTATVNITGKAINYSVTTSGNIHLLSTCTLNADFGAVMVYRMGRIGWYKSTSEAVADYGNNENHRYVKLLFADDVTVDADKELFLDVNGLAVNVNVNAGGTLRGMDTTAALDAVGEGCAIVTGEGTVAVDADRSDLGRYIAVANDGSYTFHKIQFNIHTVTLRTSATGFYYRTELFCDPVLAELVDSYGVVMSVNNVPGADFKTESKDNNRYTIMSGESFESGNVINSGSVFNIMKQGLSAAENKRRGEMKVYANAYVNFNLNDAQEIVLSDNKYVGMNANDADFKGVGYSLYDVMKSVDEMYADLSEDQQDQVKEFYDTWYAKGMSDWNLSSFSNFYAGFGRENITPDYTVHLNGGNLESRYSTDVKDQLYVTCIAVTDENGATALMITQDLINAEIAYSARTAISEATGVPFKNIMVAATHTHSAPSTAGSYENVNAYKDLYYAKVVAAAKAALEDRVPAVAQTGSADAKTENGKQLVFVRRYKQLDGGYRGGYGTNENSPLIAHAYDANETMQVVKFIRSGKKDILMTNLGAHPTFNGETSMTSISADFPGAIRDYVEANSDCLSAHFISGSADQNPTSELFWEDHGLDYIGYGNAIAKAALNMNLSNAEVGDVVFKSAVVNVASAKTDVDAATLAKAQEANAVYQNEGFAAGEAKAKELGFVGIYHARSIISHAAIQEDTQSVGVNVLKIGELAFAFAPYEMSGSTAKALVEGSPFQNTFVVSCANNSGGYIPAEISYDIGCYEGYTSRVVRGSAEVLNSKMISLLAQLSEQ